MGTETCDDCHETVECALVEVVHIQPNVAGPGCPTPTPTMLCEGCCHGRK